MCAFGRKAQGDLGKTEIGLIQKGYGKHVVSGLDAAEHLVKSDGNSILSMKNMH
jgi:hypothetical protein